MRVISTLIRDMYNSLLLLIKSKSEAYSETLYYNPVSIIITIYSFAVYFFNLKVVFDIRCRTLAIPFIFMYE